MDLTNEEVRKKELGSRTPAEIAEIVGKLSASELIGISRAVVAGLGVYELKLVMEERIGTKVLPPQTLRATIRERPRAARLEFAEGRAKGRKVLYNEQLKKGEMRVKEGGALGLVGGLWLSLDNPLAKADTRHPITDIGYGPLLDFFEKDLKKSEPYGGHTRNDLGFDARGRWTSEFVAPPGAVGLEADRAKLTLDLLLGLPVEIETFDESGLLERGKYELVKKNLEVPSNFFEPKSFGV